MITESKVYVNFQGSKKKRRGLTSRALESIFPTYCLLRAPALLRILVSPFIELHLMLLLTATRTRATSMPKDLCLPPTVDSSLGVGETYKGIWIS